MGSNETPRSMPLGLAQAREVVYTVCCGAQIRSGGMIYVEKEGVNIP